MAKTSSPPSAPAAPGSLSEHTANLWDRIVATSGDLSPTDLELLAAGLEQLDVYRDAMKKLREDGPVAVNPDSGNPKAHPALAVAHAALRAYRQTLQALDLKEVQAPPSPRRPGRKGRSEKSGGGGDPRSVLGA